VIYLEQYFRNIVLDISRCVSLGSSLDFSSFPLTQTPYGLVTQVSYHCVTSPKIVRQEATRVVHIMLTIFTIMLIFYAQKMLLISSNIFLGSLIFYLNKIKSLDMLIWMILSESQTPSRLTWPRPFSVVVKSGAVDCHAHFSTGNQESQFLVFARVMLDAHVSLVLLFCRQNVDNTRGYTKRRALVSRF